MTDRLAGPRVSFARRCWLATGKARYVAGVMTGAYVAQFGMLAITILLCCLVLVALGYEPNFS